MNKILITVSNGYLGSSFLNQYKNKYTFEKIPFSESLLKLVKRSFYKRLYGSLEVDNTLTKEKLNLKNPYSV
ncbi:hypothetical protein [Aliarcobacter vitoriensis]|uniref:hypothetical protein n=1 Tax=Aliarcobacter vitoriensis TaxID=2011099 RepID=UPI001F40C903|nr:hypothetical protein [Aliarcobacter vitoriensis]